MHTRFQNGQMTKMAIFWHFWSSLSRGNQGKTVKTSDFNAGKGASTRKTVENSDFHGFT